MRRHLLALVVAVVMVTAGAGLAVAEDPPRLSGHGPTRATGTEATAVFRVADRTVRQVRYRDHGTLVYSFRLRNDGGIPVRVEGLAAPRHTPRLFRFVSLTDQSGRRRFTLGGGDSTTVRVGLRMQSCETLSARAGSFVDEVALRVRRAGMLRDVVVVRFPEEVHTGSAREAFCPRSTATSRPPG